MTSNTNIKLIALDLDGTVLKRDHTISERVLRATRMAAEYGVLVTTATGRGAASVKRVATALSVNTAAICHHGSVIADLSTGDVLHSVTLPHDVARDAINYAQQFPNWHTVVFRGDEMLVTERRFPNSAYSLADIEPTVVQDLCGALVARSANKIMLMLDPSDTATTLCMMSDHIGDAAFVVQSSARLVEVHAREVSKGAALSRLAELLGLQRDEVMAIGDHDNDESMLAWAGLGVAMGNGSARAKAAAKWVAPTIDEDGVAVAIETHVLNHVAS